MKILVSGSSGLVGSAFLRLAAAEGHGVVRLVRRQGIAGTVYWDPAAGVIDDGKLDAFDAVVHLAGESIAARRWTAAQKARILDSRVQGSTLLATALARLAHKPRVLVSASAMGFYGDRGDEILTEDSPSGTGFLADVCRRWEAAAEPAAKAGIRVVYLRTGIVLSGSGGALARMLLPFKLGVGGKIGSGRQYMSWIALDDLARIILFAIETPALTGPVNAVAPVALTNADFTKALGRVLSRPTLFPLPAFAARLALGEMADDLLLASGRLQPAKLAATGFRYRFEDLDGALRHVLGR